MGIGAFDGMIVRDPLLEQVAMDRRPQLACPERHVVPRDVREEYKSREMGVRMLDWLDGVVEFGRNDDIARAVQRDRERDGLAPSWHRAVNEVTGKTGWVLRRCSWGIGENMAIAEREEDGRWVAGICGEGGECLCGSIEPNAAYARAWVERELERRRGR